MSYTRYDFNQFKTAQMAKSEHHVCFDEKSADILQYLNLPVERLLEMREQSAAEEQTIFNNACETMKAWEEQAGQTLLLDEALKYIRTAPVQHTGNQWITDSYGDMLLSNMVYKMIYSVEEIDENRFKRPADPKIIWVVNWSVWTNSPCRYGAKIAGQDKKRFESKAAMDSYLSGRIKAYSRFFTDLCPPVPPAYAEYFSVSGQLLPGYTLEGEETKPNA